LCGMPSRGLPWVACRHATQPRVGMEDAAVFSMLTRRFAS
jgi:hypothetical protein